MARKIAICVGQNDYAPHTQVPPLRGCVNDVLLIGEMLRVAGFDIIRQIHNEAATQKGILDRLSSEIAKLRAGDQLVFWNSSHGYQVQDRSGDELVDGLDEAICTYDTDSRDPLTDDKFAKIFSRIHPEAFVFFASDSCHSATLSRTLQGNHTSKNHPEDRRPRLWTPPDDVFFRSGRPTINLGKYVAGFKKPIGKRKTRRLGLLHRKENINHLFLSGCKADEVSWDAKFDQGYHGAMTYHFAMTVLNSWENKKPITYQKAFNLAVKGIKKAKYDQNPQLEGPTKLSNQYVFGFKP